MSQNWHSGKGWVIKTSLGKTICRISASRNRGLSDAHLIAAAPDLLEACKLIIHLADSDASEAQFNACISDARAAIALAEGGDK